MKIKGFQDRHIKRFGFFDRGRVQRPNTFENFFDLWGFGGINKALGLVPLRQGGQAGFLRY